MEKTIDIDSTCFLAQNSRKANYSAEKIRCQIAYIDQKVSDYLEEMQAIDRKEKTKVKDIQRLLKLTQDKEAMERSTETDQRCFYPSLFLPATLPKENLNVLPKPIPLSTLTVPPMASISSLQIERPMPEPFPACPGTWK